MREDEVESFYGYPLPPAEPYVPLPADRAPEPAECGACGNNVLCEPHPFVFRCGHWFCADCGTAAGDSDEGGY